MGSLFAVMEFEKAPVSFGDIPKLLLSWFQDAGGFAFVGLILWILYVMLTSSPAAVGSRRSLISKFMGTTAVVALIGYLVFGGLSLAVMLDQQKKLDQGLIPKPPPNSRGPIVMPETPLSHARDWALAVAGAFALMAFCEPFFRDLFQIRLRRVYALAKLSFKESVRARVVWVFLLLLIPFLFPVSWFHKGKTEDELKSIVAVSFFCEAVLMLVMGAVLVSFSIPNEVRRQTIQTVVTKPVERFELVAGKVLGYMAILTIALFAAASLNLIFISTSNISEEARQESMKARMPVYGHLDFRSSSARDQKTPFEGIDVGREYSYRKFIAGGDKTPYRAVWQFSASTGTLKSLADQQAVPCEFAFDVFRTTKGTENRGVLCSFYLQSWKWDPHNPNLEKEYTDAIRAAFGSPRNILPPSPERADEQTKALWEKANKIAEKFGRFDWLSIPVVDYHTQKFYFPPGLLKNALEGNPQDKNSPRLMVEIKCESPTQFIGVAPYDLYLLEAEGSFWLNFFEGQVGLWCWLWLVVTIGAAASTYLAGVISLLLVIALFIAGLFKDFLQSLVEGTNVGGGPSEALIKLVTGDVPNSQLSDSALNKTAQYIDVGFRWGLNRIFNIIPDVSRYDWSEFVEQGFSIRPEFLIMNCLFLAGYLLPWAVAAYYLMRSREIAA